MADEPPLTVRRCRAEPGRFFVKSERRHSDDWYTVDFTDEEFPRGRCSCPDYDFRIEYPMRAGKAPTEDRCKHIRTALAMLEHAQQLCESAGLTFDERIIPSFHD